MKNALITIIILFTLSSVQGQYVKPSQGSNPQEFYDYYTFKQKQNNRTGWICLGGGVGLVLLGSASTIFGLQEENEDLIWDGVLSVVIGGVTTIASTVFFIKAGSNKRKARLSLQHQVSYIQPVKYRKSQSFGFNIEITID
jgi:hypothetical protein